MHNQEKEALGKITTGRYAVVVSDYNMPEMTGVELLKGVRSFSRIPFILFTGMGEREIIDEAIENNVDFYLEKGEELHIIAFKLSQMILAGVYRSQKRAPGLQGEIRFWPMMCSCLSPLYNRIQRIYRIHV